MASLETCASPYSQAAFEFAKASKTIPAWEKALALFSDIIEDNNIKSLLSRPQVSPVQLVDTLIACLKNNKLTKKTSTNIHNFMLLLANNKKLSLLPFIYTQFLLLKRQNEAALMGEIISTSKLTQTQITAVKNKLRDQLKKQIELTPIIDPSLLGGFMVKLGDQVIDQSIKGQLTSLATELRR